jgi:DNA polymerase, archaea type
VKSRPAPFAENQILFGRDGTPAIVSAELTGDSEITVYRRAGDKITTETQSFHPFLWLAEQVYLQGFDRKVEYVPLKGSGTLKFLARFQSWPDCQRARKFLGAASSFTLNDPVQQYLLATGRTSFDGMPFEELYRMQLAIVVNAEGAIQAIQLGDSQDWQQELTGNEPQILKKLVELVCERDPDVL